MSAASIQQTCAACGLRFEEGTVRLETLIDVVVRTVAVHVTCSIYKHKESEGDGRE